MHFLIDGYNLMYAAGLMKPQFGPGGLEKARRALLGVLAGSLGSDAAHTTVVFDSRQRSKAQAEQVLSFHSLHVEFASGEEGADARIEELIRREPTPKLLQVVSSDARIRTAAKHRGSHAVDSDTFWEKLVADRRARQPATPPPPEKPTHRAPAELDYWLHEFQDLIDEEDLRELAGPFADEIANSHDRQN